MALTLTRKVGESIILETPGVPPIHVKVVLAKHGRAKLSITADSDTRISRSDNLSEGTQLERVTDGFDSDT